MPDFGRMIDEFIYSVIVMIAGVHWSLQKVFIMAGYTIKLINQWLIDNAFMPIIAQTNDSLRVAVSYVFIIALLVLGLTYMLAALIRLDVVSPRNAITWYAAGALFFTIGPSFYQGMNDFRLNIAQLMYMSVLDGMNTHSGDFSSLSQVSSSDLDLGLLCDQFDVYLPGATHPGSIDGLDIAMAYLRGHAQDVMGYPQPIFSPDCGIYLHNPNPSTWAGASGTSVVPMDWNMEGGYFDHNTSPITWDNLTGDERSSVVSWAGASQQRALTAWPLLIFALIEQVVHLLITIAMGITFISFGIAILFAFFKRTESIAHNIINQWIELIVQTTIIALIQALVTGFFLAGAATGSAAAIIGIGLLCLVFILITMWSGIKAVWNSFNRLFNAMSQVSGNVMVTPGTAALTTVGAGAMAAGAAVSTGSNALAGMTALNRGATMAQAAGVALGGSRTLSGAARTLAYLPGARNTPLGEAAEQFTEGSITRQVASNIPVVGRIAAPIVGAALLSNRDPAQAEVNEQGQIINRPMLVPAVGAGLNSWTVPRGTGNDEPSQRMGTFTPSNAEAQHNREMVGEEMEQHISDTLNSGQLKQAADALMRAAQMMHGQLKVTGVPNVASVMGDVVGQVQHDRQQNGQSPIGNISHLQVADHMARTMGIIPQNTSTSPIQRDLARFGLFVDQALKLGLTPQQTEQVVRETHTSPDRQMQPATRDMIDQQVQITQNISWLKARDEVNKLEHNARMLPTEITAQGSIKYTDAMKKESAMGGSGNVIGGGS